MNDLVADTHSAIWYYAGKDELSRTAREAMDSTILSGGSIFIPAISLVEVVYLVEKGRIPAVTHDLLAEALANSIYCLRIVPLDQAIAATLKRVPRDLVPDMPDRIITATALHLDLPLVTADRKIHSSRVVTVIW